MILNKIPEKKPDLIWRSLDDGTVVIDPEHGDVIVLNEVGARVWELVDGKLSVEQIALEITRDFEVSLDDAHKDLKEFLLQMVNQDLLQWQD